MKRRGSVFFIVQAGKIKKQDTVRREPVVFFSFLSQTIFSMMPNCFLPSLRDSQLALHLASNAAGNCFLARQQWQKSKIVCLVVSRAISEHRWA